MDTGGEFNFQARCSDGEFTTSILTEDRYLKLVTPSRHTPGTASNALSRSRLANLLLVLGPLFFLISVFFEWRHTQGLAPQGIINLSATAWETGLLGGQGLFLAAAIFLVAFPLLRRRFQRISSLLLVSPFLILTFLMLILTLKQVLGMYSGSGDLVHLHTYLGIGFYLAMLGGNLLVFAIILLLSGGRK